MMEEHSGCADAIAVLFQLLMLIICGLGIPSPVAAVKNMN